MPSRVPPHALYGGVQNGGQQGGQNGGHNGGHVGGMPVNGHPMTGGAFQPNMQPPVNAPHNTAHLPPMQQMGGQAASFQQQQPMWNQGATHMPQQGSVPASGYNPNGQPQFNGPYGTPFPPQMQPPMSGVGAPQYGQSTSNSHGFVQPHMQPPMGAVHAGSGGQQYGQPTTHGNGAPRQLQSLMQEPMGGNQGSGYQPNYQPMMHSTQGHGFQPPMGNAQGGAFQPPPTSQYAQQSGPAAPPSTGHYAQQNGQVVPPLMGNNANHGNNLGGPSQSNVQNGGYHQHTTGYNYVPHQQYQNHPIPPAPMPSTSMPHSTTATSTRSSVNGSPEMEQMRMHEEMNRRLLNELLAPIYRELMISRQETARRFDVFELHWAMLYNAQQQVPVGPMRAPQVPMHNAPGTAGETTGAGDGAPGLTNTSQESSIEPSTSGARGSAEENQIQPAVEEAIEKQQEPTTSDVQVSQKANATIEENKIVEPLVEPDVVVMAQVSKIVKVTETVPKPDEIAEKEMPKKTSDESKQEMTSEVKQIPATIITITDLDGTSKADQKQNDSNMKPATSKTEVATTSAEIATTSAEVATSTVVTASRGEDENQQKNTACDDLRYIIIENDEPWREVSSKKNNNASKNGSSAKQGSSKAIGSGTSSKIVADQQKTNQALAREIIKAMKQKEGGMAMQVCEKSENCLREIIRENDAAVNIGETQPLLSNISETSQSIEPKEASENREDVVATTDQLVSSETTTGSKSKKAKKAETGKKKEKKAAKEAKLRQEAEDEAAFAEQLAWNEAQPKKDEKDLPVMDAKRSKFGFGRADLQIHPAINEMIESTFDQIGEFNRSSQPSETEKNKDTFKYPGFFDVFEEELSFEDNEKMRLIEAIKEDGYRKFSGASRIVERNILDEERSELETEGTSERNETDSIDGHLVTRQLVAEPIPDAGQVPHHLAGLSLANVVASSEEVPEIMPPRSSSAPPSFRRSIEEEIREQEQANIDQFARNPTGETNEDASPTPSSHPLIDFEEQGPSSTPIAGASEALIFSENVRKSILARICKLKDLREVGQVKEMYEDKTHFFNAAFVGYQPLSSTISMDLAKRFCEERIVKYFQKCDVKSTQYFMIYQQLLGQLDSAIAPEICFLHKQSNTEFSETTENSYLTLFFNS